MLSQRRMPDRVLADVVLIVICERQLNLPIARAVESHLIKGIAVRTDQLRIRKARGVLIFRGLRRNGLRYLLLRGGIAILPVRLHVLSPERTKPFDVSIPVLRDDRRDTLRMRNKQTKPDGRAIILDVHAETPHAD